MSGKQLLTTREAASYLGIPLSTLYAMCASKKITFARIGVKSGAYRFRREWLDSHLLACTVAAEGPEKDEPTPDESNLRFDSQTKKRSAKSGADTGSDIVRRAKSAAMNNGVGY